jgi:hypothetical protein
VRFGSHARPPDGGPRCRRPEPVCFAGPRQENPISLGEIQTQNGEPFPGLPRQIDSFHNTPGQHTGQRPGRHPSNPGLSPRPRPLPRTIGNPTGPSNPLARPAPRSAAGRLSPYPADGVSDKPLSVRDTGVSAGRRTEQNPCSRPVLPLFHCTTLFGGFQEVPGTNCRKGDLRRCGNWVILLPGPPERFLPRCPPSHVQAGRLLFQPETGEEKGERKCSRWTSRLRA